MPSQAAPLINQICSTPSCGKFVRARGFCVACYYRNLRQKKIEPGTPTRGWKHRISKIDLITKMGLCSTCGHVKLSISKNRIRCSIDANARSKDYKRAYRQSKKNQLLDHCEICKGTDDLCWDHNHETNEFRGTLCVTCNSGIGLLKDNPEYCLNAATYLIEKSSYGK